MAKFSTVSLLCFGWIVAVASGLAIIDPALKARFIGGGGGSPRPQNVQVSFIQSIQSVFSQISGMNFTSQLEKRQVLTQMQEAFTNTSQSALKAFLDSLGVNYHSFWINNKMVIPNANPGLVNAISAIPGVAKIEPEPVGRILLPHDFSEKFNLTMVGKQNQAQWGIRKIRADQVWGQYTGRGVVVANIDTGVRYTHGTLRNTWRSEYGWYDPFRQTALPYDDQGHGTHTMGTIAGSHGIGVAPESTWIACKGCAGRECPQSALYYCGQWIQCPSRPDGTQRRCDLAPRVVSNSWGGVGGYDDVIKSWRESGIIVVFAIGNSGPNCGTANEPGTNRDVIAVGNTNSNDGIFNGPGGSSRGPTRDGRIKPDISAPGTDIISASHQSDTQGSQQTGTSMAAPHVSGMIALMLQRNAGLNHNQVYNVVAQSAVRNLNTNSAQPCGGVSSNSWPNNAFGYGRIDAINALNSV